MGLFDIPCLVCGGPPHGHLFMYIHPACPEEVAWLDDYVGVPDSNTPLSISYDGTGTFSLCDVTAMRDSPPYGFCFHSAMTDDLRGIPEGDQYGLTCHEACYRFLSARMGYKLRFEDVWPLLKRSHFPEHHLSAKATLHSDYGGITKYHGQFFESEALLEDGKSWMLMDPNGCEQNAERIVALWRPHIDAFKQARLEQFQSMLTALFCSFSRAHQLSSHNCKPRGQARLWTAMAKVPFSVVYLIGVAANCRLV